MNESEVRNLMHWNNHTENFNFSIDAILLVRRFITNLDTKLLTVQQSSHTHTHTINSY